MAVALFLKRVKPGKTGPWEPGLLSTRIPQLRRDLPNLAARIQQNYATTEATRCGSGMHVCTIRLRGLIQPLCSAATSLPCRLLACLDEVLIKMADAGTADARLGKSTKQVVQGFIDRFKQLIEPELAGYKQAALLPTLKSTRKHLQVRALTGEQLLEIVDLEKRVAQYSRRWRKLESELYAGGRGETGEAGLFVLVIMVNELALWKIGGQHEQRELPQPRASKNHSGGIAVA